MSIRLLYITNQICGAAGLERVLSIKTNTLIETYDYEIHILTLNQGTTPLFFDFNNKIKIHDISVSGNPISYLRSYSAGIKRVVDTANPDVISVCDDGLKGFFVPALLSKKTPIIYERHVSKNIETTADTISFFNKVKLKITYSLMNWRGNKFNAFIVLTTDNIAEWNLKNIRVISNPLPFETSEKSDLNNKIVLAVGRHHYQKGYDRLLDSWKIISEKFPEWQLHIFGKIDPNLKLKEQSVNLQVDNSVTFFKPIKAIEEAYKKASIYVMPSRFEGFGMVLIEAMAYGVPTISYDCPCGPKDIIANNEDGFLIENGNIDAFANAIETLIIDENLRDSMGKKAKENVKRYEPRKIGKQWHSLFSELVKK